MHGWSLLLLYLSHVVYGASLTEWMVGEFFFPVCSSVPTDSEGNVTTLNHHNDSLFTPERSKTHVEAGDN